MKAHGGLARIAGFPVRGGVVSLDNADVQVAANATAGLIRETAGVVKTGIKAGAIVGGLLALLLLLQTPKEQLIKQDKQADRQRKMREAWLQIPPLPLSAFCRVIVRSIGHNCYSYGELSTFHGVLLNETISFSSSSSSTTLHAKPEHMLALQTDTQSHAVDRPSYTVVMADGSTYAVSHFNAPLRFATPCGEFVIPIDKTQYDVQILPFTESELIELRDRMISFFKYAERDLIHELDLDILSRYLTLKEAEAEPTPPPPVAQPTKPPQAKAVPVKSKRTQLLKKWANEHRGTLWVVGIVFFACLIELGSRIVPS